MRGGVVGREGWRCCDRGGVNIRGKRSGISERDAMFDSRFLSILCEMHFQSFVLKLGR